MKQLNLYTKLLKAPKNSPVFLTQNLESEFLIKAYSFGLFPWSSKPVSWWCPDPRCVLFPDEIHIQKNMKKELKRYEIRLDYDFNALIKLCKNHRKLTWISNEFVQIYTELFKQKFAHSLEIYDDGQLVGGIYGLMIGKMFFGESMVSLKPNVSKVALIKLCELLQSEHMLLDCQIHNPHLEFMGAKNISRSEFLNILQDKIKQETPNNLFKENTIY